MACGIKLCIQLELLFTKKQAALLNDLVISHMQYCAVLLNGILKKTTRTLENNLAGQLRPHSVDKNTIIQQILILRITSFKSDSS